MQSCAQSVGVPRYIFCCDLRCDFASALTTLLNPCEVFSCMPAHVPDIWAGDCPVCQTTKGEHAPLQGEDVLCMQRQHQTLSARGALSPQLSHASEGLTQPWDRQPDFQRRLPTGRRPAGFVRTPAPVAQQVHVARSSWKAGLSRSVAWGLCCARSRRPAFMGC